MVKVVGIRFRNAGKIYYFGPGKLQLKAGMHVIVETARGVELGTVMTNPREVSEESVIQPLKPVIRIATEQDEKQVEKNREKEKEAYKICQEKIAKHHLDMKLVEAEYTFDNNTVPFPRDGEISDALLHLFGVLSYWAKKWRLVLRNRWWRWQTGFSRSRRETW